MGFFCPLVYDEGFFLFCFLLLFLPWEGVVRSLWTPGYVADSSWEPACSKFGRGVSLKLENAAA